MLKKSVVIKRRGMNLPKIDLKNILFYALFFSGLIVGVTTIKNSDNKIFKIIEIMINDYIIENSSFSFLENLLSSLFLLLLPLCFIFIFGLCAVGSPIILATPGIVGLISGMAVSFFYIKFSFEGLGYATLILIPPLAILIATLIKSCSEGINMSLIIVMNILGANEIKNNKNILKEYCLKFLILALPLFIAAVLNAGCYKLFSGLFSFS